MIKPLSIIACIVVPAVLAAVGSTPSTSSCPIPSSEYRADTTVIKVTSNSDFSKRVQFPASQHVTLEIQNDIADVSLLMDSTFSNTTMISACGVGFKLSSPVTAQIPILIIGASRISIIALEITIFYDHTPFAYLIAGAQESSILSDYTVTSNCTDTRVTDNQSRFAEVSRTWIHYVFPHFPCASVQVFDSEYVEIIGNSLYGTLSLINVSTTVVDGNFVTSRCNGHGIYATNNNDLETLTYSPVVIRNNYVNGTGPPENYGGIGIKIGDNAGPMAMGIEILNNNISNFGWAGMMVGLFNSAISNYFAHNILTQSPGFPAPPDATNLYVTTWRFGVNNTFKFNYFNGTNRHCIYNDGWSSGSTYDTNICANTDIIYKNNMAWKVNMTNTLAYNPARQFVGWCLVVQNSTCIFKKPPLPSSAWTQSFPWVFDVCTATEFNGIPCSPTPELAYNAGNCSGLPLFNNFQFAAVPGPDTAFSNRALNIYEIDTYKLPITPVPMQSHFCGNYSSTDALNSYSMTIYSNTNITIDSNGLVRVVPQSVLAADMPTIASFPYDILGVQSIQWPDVSGVKVAATQPPPPPQSTQITSVSGIQLSVGTSVFTLEVSDINRSDFDYIFANTQPAWTATPLQIYYTHGVSVATYNFTFIMPGTYYIMYISGKDWNIYATAGPLTVSDASTITDDNATVITGNMGSTSTVGVGADVVVQLRTAAAQRLVGDYIFSNTAPAWTPAPLQLFFNNAQASAAYTFTFATRGTYYIMYVSPLDWLIHAKLVVQVGQATQITSVGGSSALRAGIPSEFFVTTDVAVRGVADYIFSNSQPVWTQAPLQIYLLNGAVQGTYNFTFSAPGSYYIMYISSNDWGIHYTLGPLTVV